MARAFYCSKCKQWVDRPTDYTLTETKMQHEADHRAADTHPDIMELDVYLESMYGE